MIGTHWSCYISYPQLASVWSVSVHNIMLKFLTWLVYDQYQYIILCFRSSPGCVWSVTIDAVMFQIHTWMVYFTLDMSIWILVALTFERLISVYLPHRVKKHCTTVTALLSLSAIAVLLLCLNSHFLYGMGDKQNLWVWHVGYLTYDRWTLNNYGANETTPSCSAGSNAGGISLPPT